MSEEFHRVYGILSAESVGGNISLPELQSIFYTLDVSEYYPNLAKVLRSRYSIYPDTKIPLSVAVAALKHKEFVLSLPLRTAHRPTYINLLLLEAAILIYKKGLLRLKEIKMAAQGFLLATKTSGTNYVSLDPKEINKAMRFADKTMSEKKIQTWIDKYSEYLFWKQDLQNLTSSYTSKGEKQFVKVPQIYPHEFLYLITNAVDRLSYIKDMKLHKQMNIKEASLKRYLVPMEELLIHPQCNTIDEEMQRELNQQYDFTKANLIFEGMNPNFLKGRGWFPSLKSGSGGARKKTRREAIKEEKKLFTDPKTYDVIKLELGGMNRNRPVLSGNTTARQLISALKKTSVYSKVTKRNPAIYKSTIDNSSFGRSSLEQYTTVIRKTPNKVDTPLNRSVLEEAAKLASKGRPRTASAHRYALAQRDKRRRKIVELCKVIDAQQDLLPAH